MQFVVGMRVYHTVFGYGTVIRISKRKNSTLDLVIVEFDTAITYIEENCVGKECSSKESAIRKFSSDTNKLMEVKK